MKCHKKGLDISTSFRKYSPKPTPTSSRFKLSWVQVRRTIFKDTKIYNLAKLNFILHIPISRFSLLSSQTLGYVSKSMSMQHWSARVYETIFAFKDVKEFPRTTPNMPIHHIFGLFLWKKIDNTSFQCMCAWDGVCVVIARIKY